ncbi:unnamed protein product [Trichobilharzia regenti]|nr:unnamed protein product [Trichobilharzia regenti]
MKDGRLVNEKMTEFEDGQQKEKLSSLCTALDKQVKKSSERDKSQFYDTLGTEAEQAGCRKERPQKAISGYQVSIRKEINPDDETNKRCSKEADYQGRETNQTIG